MTKYKRILAFDFGLKRIGVAAGQTVTHSARPLTTVSANNGEPQWATIDKLIAEWSPQLLVVGNPLNMNGTEQKITQNVKKFSTALHQRYALPVQLFDERLTTIEARSRIFDKGGYKALQKNQIDAEAAVIILEAWMHAQESANTNPK